MSFGILQERFVTHLFFATFIFCDTLIFVGDPDREPGEPADVHPEMWSCRRRARPTRAGFPDKW
jgi:hypothetical protein